MIFKKIALIMVGFFFMLHLVVAVEPALTVINPTEGIAYNTTLINVQLNTNSSSIFYYADMNSSGNWIKICPKKDLNCMKKISMREGNNFVAFKAVDGNNADSDIKLVNFSVDSRKPVIKKLYPPINSITNGSLFSVSYNKNNFSNGKRNLKLVNLSYGLIDNLNASLRYDCPAGMNQHCDFNNVSLSELDGQYIWYWFTVSDGASTVQSAKTKVKVDITPPVISVQDPIVSGRTAKLIFDVIEDNFDKITYQDSNTCGQAKMSINLLCTRLNVKRCVVIRSFCPGTHELNIMVSDKAGNSVNQTTSFTIEP
ncbi:MAG: hypothetical protein Q7S74_06865 [Nanoarchaeota archaeon]|nr:hypothetical protein [Nanoarchaeota archaeon]